MQSYQNQILPFAGTQTLTMALQDKYGQQGWRVTVHNYYPKDKRDDWSTFACVHNAKQGCQEFNFVPFGNGYKIYLIGNDFNQKGWAMTCHKHYPQDKRDDWSTRVFFHMEDNQKGQIWQVVPCRETGKHRIALADPNSEFNGWFLTSHRHYDNDKRDDSSNFLFLHQKEVDSQLWDLPVTPLFTGKQTVTMALQDKYGQQGWKMTCHNYYPQDKRDDSSTFACIHNANQSCQEFMFVPVGSHYKIVLLGNDFKQAGALLTCHSYYPKDKRDDWSTRVFFHVNDNVGGQLWKVVQDRDTGKFRIAMADPSSQFKGWYLTAHKYYDLDTRDSTSHYLFLHKEIQEGQLWDLPITPQYSGKYSLVSAEDAYGHQGWAMTVHNWYPQDKRDDHSTFACIHREQKDCQEFNLVPVGANYKLYLTGNEFKQAGHVLTCHKHHSQDKRDDSSYRVFLHKDDKHGGQIWQIVPDSATGKFRLAVADQNSEFRGWYLTAHRYYDSDKRDDHSTYLCVHREIKDGQLWDLKRK